jgi:antitoxin component of RelBE/YafQ-DinJ toxin-antitoxin module
MTAMPNAPRADNRHRMVRVTDDLWDAAKAAAADLGIDVSKMIREDLEKRVAAHRRRLARRPADDE